MSAGGKRLGQDIARAKAGREMQALPVDGRSLAMVILLNRIRLTFSTNAATDAGVL